jgi:hypothetical protein
VRERHELHVLGGCAAQNPHNPSVCVPVCGALDGVTQALRCRAVRASAPDSRDRVDPLDALARYDDADAVPGRSGEP